MKKLAMLSLACMLAFPMTVRAEDADRIAALEEKVAALEQRVAALEGGTPAGVSEAPAQEVVAPPADVETGLEYDGCTLEYVGCEVTTDRYDKPCVVLYFDYFNGSGETRSYYGSYTVKAFQYGKQMDLTGVSDNEAFDNLHTELRSGADTLRVANCFSIDDTSEIIVSLKGIYDFDNDPVEFTVSLE